MVEESFVAVKRYLRENGIEDAFDIGVLFPENQQMAMNKQNTLKNALGEIAKSDWLQNESERQKNKAWIKKSQSIALHVMEWMDSNKTTQKRLAEMLGVSPQLVNKWLRGEENFTLETICKLEAVMDTDIIHILTSEKVNTSIQKASAEVLTAK